MHNKFIKSAVLLFGASTLLISQQVLATRYLVVDPHINDGNLLDKDSPSTKDGHRGRDHYYRAMKGEIVTITVTARESYSYPSLIDPMVQVTTPDDKVVINDNAEGLGTGARVTVQSPIEGYIKIDVTTAVPNQFGWYNLWVTSNFQPGKECTPANGYRPLMFDGVTLHETLGEPTDSGRTGTVEYPRFDYFRYYGEAGETIRVQMKATDFEPVMKLEQVKDKFWPVVAQTQGTNSFTYTLPETGNYMIRAMATVPDPKGDYSIRLESSSSRCQTPISTPDEIGVAAP